MFNSNQKSKVVSPTLMDELSTYLNQLLAFSPLISNLIYARDFITTDRSGSAVKIESPSFTLRRLMSYEEAKNYCHDNASKHIEQGENSNRQTDSKEKNSINASFGVDADNEINQEMMNDYANDRTDSFANAFEQYNSDPNTAGIDLTFQGLG